MSNSEYVLVPREPTEEMIRAGMKARNTIVEDRLGDRPIDSGFKCGVLTFTGEELRAAFVAMLTASPSPAVPGEIETAALEAYPTPFESIYSEEDNRENELAFAGREGFRKGAAFAANLLATPAPVAGAEAKIDLSEDHEQARIAMRRRLLGLDDIDLTAAYYKAITLAEHEAARRALTASPQAPVVSGDWKWFTDSDEKISQEEMLRLFGPEMPIEAAQMLFNPNMGIREMRENLAKMAAKHAPSPSHDEEVRKALEALFGLCAAMRFEPDAGQPHPIKDGVYDKVMAQARTLIDGAKP